MLYRCNIRTLERIKIRTRYTIRLNKLLVQSFFISIGMLMKKTPQILMLFVTTFSITACASPTTKQADIIGAAEWDFDHQIQFRQTELAKNSFQLEIIPNNKVNFARMSAFLLRKSYQLCRQYSYQLEILQGIEGFDDKHAMPNYIFPSLIAKIECNTKSNQKPHKEK